MLFDFQLYLFFIFKHLELGAFSTAEHLHRRRVSVQRFKQLVILHLVEWLGDFVLQLLFDVEEALSLCRHDILKSTFLCLLELELGCELLASSVAPAHFLFVLHPHELVRHLADAGSHGPLLEFVKKSLEIHPLERCLNIRVLFLSYCSFLPLAPRILINCLVEIPLLLSFHARFLRRRLILTIISHANNLLLTIIILALGRILQDLVDLIYSHKVILISTSVDIGVVLSSRFEVRNLKLLV